MNKMTPEDIQKKMSILEKLNNFYDKVYKDKFKTTANLIFNSLFASCVNYIISEEDIDLCEQRARGFINYYKNKLYKTKD